MRVGVAGECAGCVGMIVNVMTQHTHYISTTRSMSCDSIALKRVMRVK